MTSQRTDGVLMVLGHCHFTDTAPRPSVHHLAPPTEREITHYDPTKDDVTAYRWGSGGPRSLSFHRHSAPPLRPPSPAVREITHNNLTEDDFTCSVPRGFWWSWATVI